MPAKPAGLVASLSFIAPFGAELYDLGDNSLPAA